MTGGFAPTATPSLLDAVVAIYNETFKKPASTPCLRNDMRFHCAQTGPTNYSERRAIRTELNPENRLGHFARKLLDSSAIFLRRNIRIDRFSKKGRHLWICGMGRGRWRVFRSTRLPFVTI